MHRVFACAKSYATIYGMFDDAQHDGAHLYVTTGSVLYGGGSVVRMNGDGSDVTTLAPVNAFTLAVDDRYVYFDASVSTIAKVCK